MKQKHIILIIAKGDSLKAGQTRGLKLSVKYNNVNSILDEDIILKLGATLIYVQASNSNQGGENGSISGEKNSINIVRNYNEISNYTLLDDVYVIESDIPISDYSKIVLSDNSLATINLSEEYQEGGKYKIKVGLSTYEVGSVSIIIEEGAYINFGNIVSDPVIIAVSSYTGIIAECNNSCVNSGNTCTSSMIKKGVLCKVVEQYNKSTGETTTPEDYYVLSDDGNNISLIKLENVPVASDYHFEFSCDKRTSPDDALAMITSYYQLNEINGWYVPWNKFDYNLYIYEYNYGFDLDSPSNVVYYQQQSARLPRYSEIYSNAPNIILNSSEFLVSGYRYGFTDVASPTEGSLLEYDQFYTNKSSYNCGSYSDIGLKPVIQITKYRVLGE